MVSGRDGGVGWLWGISFISGGELLFEVGEVR